MNITIITDTRTGRPVVTIDGKIHKPDDYSAYGLNVAVNVRQNLYSGKFPAGQWDATERFLDLMRFGAAGARGGKVTGKSKSRGGKAYYRWITACREAKRNGLPRPDRPIRKRNGASHEEG